MAVAPIVGRFAHTAVWSGSDMIVWGGTPKDPSVSGCPAKGAYCSDGAAYNVASDTWVKLPAPPIPGRRDHTAVWTGSEMIVWGGIPILKGPFGDGASYDPVASKWTTLPSASITGRYEHSAVWSTTTNEMIVWGGIDSKFTTTVLSDGARYKPATGTWSSMKAPPATFVARSLHAAVWTGSKMIISGGCIKVGGGYSSQCHGSGGAFANDAAAYDPLTDTWTLLPAPPTTFDGRVGQAATIGGSSGSLAMFWGGENDLLAVGGSFQRADGAYYDTALDLWTAIPAPADVVLPNPKRAFPCGWATATKLWIWGGGNSIITDSGASYDIATGTWTSMPAGGPSARNRATTVWTGTAAILWGGYGGEVTNTGMLFKP
ncbi:MAG: hypothetical protein NVSMB1_12400 [Polyangiales bacterium]